MKKLLLFISATLLLGACGKTSADNSNELFISAASSLSEAMQAAEVEFVKSHPDIELVFNYGSSSKLANQIEQGAPVDLFLSASERDMKRVTDQNIIMEETVELFAGNRLVLASAKELDKSLGFAQLVKAGGGTVAVGEPESVPLGAYAKQALEDLGLWQSLDGKLIYAKDARQVLTYVESGNAALGIVYSSDASIAPAVKTIIAMPETTTPIVYPAGISADAENRQAAESFLTFLTGPKGQKLLKDYGFGPAEEGRQ